MKTELISCSFVNAPGMVQNFERAVKAKDETFIKMFKACYALKGEQYQKLADGRYEINEELESVTIL